MSKLENAECGNYEPINKFHGLVYKREHVVFFRIKLQQKCYVIQPRQSFWSKDNQSRRFLCFDAQKFLFTTEINHYNYKDNHS